MPTADQPPTEALEETLTTFAITILGLVDQALDDVVPIAVPFLPALLLVGFITVTLVAMSEIAPNVAQNFEKNPLNWPTSH